MSALVSLASDINREHQFAFGKAREALEHARRAGELLIQAKAGVPHGEWLPWLAANVVACMGGGYFQSYAMPPGFSCGGRDGGPVVCGRPQGLHQT